MKQPTITSPAFSFAFAVFGRMLSLSFLPQPVCLSPKFRWQGPCIARPLPSEFREKWSTCRYAHASGVARSGPTRGLWRPHIGVDQEARPLTAQDGHRLLQGALQQTVLAGR